ncbi:MORN repeat variant [Apibacter mensalis]|uniref:MORN repeat variant n=1 Tax=Apibacter mensalis TaxID=1586267 RepID=A0A0X3AMZ4_9FLAO|nr:hypothetical protein [Apibacter mensalis]CVK15603.1 MORN repeat variant [Apibacter mensalis]
MSHCKKNIYLLFAIVLISCNTSFADENKHEFNKTLSTDSASCQKPIIEYFPNGKLKLSGCQGIFNGTGIQVGLWKTYDEKGDLIETTYYHPDEFGKDYKIVTQYKNGKVVSKKIYNFDDLYETELKELFTIPK